MSPRAVIFDIDGTLIDSVDAHAEAWSRAFHKFGYEVSPEQARAQIGKGGDQLMPVFLPKDVVEREGKAIEAFRGDLFKREYLPGLSAFPGVRLLFERVRAAGARALLASSASEEEVKRYAKMAEIEHLLDDMASKDDAKTSKPSPDIFVAALEKAGLAPREALIVGDSPYDAEAAGKAGIGAIAVLSGGFPEEALSAAGYRAIFRDPKDLLARFGSWFA